jgi:hypothetical protein
MGTSFQWTNPHHASNEQPPNTFTKAKSWYDDNVKPWIESRARKSRSKRSLPGRRYPYSDSCYSQSDVSSRSSFSDMDDLAFQSRDEILERTDLPFNVCDFLLTPSQIKQRTKQDDARTGSSQADTGQSPSCRPRGHSDFESEDNDLPPRYSTRGRYGYRSRGPTSLAGMTTTRSQDCDLDEDYARSLLAEHYFDDFQRRGLHDQPFALDSTYSLLSGAQHPWQHTSDGACWTEALKRAASPGVLTVR